MLLIGGATLVALWAACVLALMLAGRRAEAIALARFAPDCLVLSKRLVADPRVARRHKLAFVALIMYLALPFDLVPDFIPVAGQLDDAILVVLVLRLALRASGPALLEEHWPGPRRGLAVLLRAASLGPRRTPAVPR